MNFLKKSSKVFVICLMLIGLNLTSISADSPNATQATHYWRICGRTWTKAEFNLPSAAPNVVVNVSWAYNYDTASQIYVWTVSNASKVSFSVSGQNALPRINVSGYGTVAANNYYPGNCRFTNLPVGTQPF